ncbi:MAG: flagellin lysine-N-methylase [Lachnospiraceae bacterium]|nr:flagellin lysine-N-methylase [Lachnospiraceae bacterium]MDY4971199.1 flagellin lysine-N-methylase [Lachnospiraceae bacterium]
MRYCKPFYYDTFRCLAGDCPDTCCAGWQIYIDDESLEKYEQEEGPFGSRLANSIDWEEGAFYQDAGRCAFLNEENLCDLQQELGEDGLCETCRRYPRHVEEFDGLRELSLSLSCPEAARMLLTCREPERFVRWETEEEEDSFEEDEMDYLLFTRLEDAREVMLQILGNRGIPVEKRMKLVLELAEGLQDCMDEDRSYDMDGVVDRYRNAEEGTELPDSDEPRSDVQVSELYASAQQVLKRYEICCREFPVFHKMEHLRPEWGLMLDDMWDTLYASGPEQYEKICRTFHDFCEGSSENHALRQQTGERLMTEFIYTYFCGAVYDEEIAVKVRFAVFSTRWIQELVMYRFTRNNGRLSMEDVIEMSWKYAREIEHSDINLGILEEVLNSNNL